MNMMNELQSVVYNCRKLILPPVWSAQRRQKSEMCWGQCLSFFCAPGNAHVHTQHTQRQRLISTGFASMSTSSYFRYLHFCSLQVLCCRKCCSVWSGTQGEHAWALKHSRINIGEHIYMYVYTSQNTCWALWFSQLQPTAARVQHKISEKAGKEGIT